MDNFEIIVLLMSAAIVLVSISQKIHIPYPLALVFGGAVIGFIPGLNSIHFDPNLILVVVLPPILYYAAIQISSREFRQNFRHIFSLAIGLVIVTTLVVGLIFKWLFPEFSWELAFAFGAIVSPPDATATTVILKRFAIGSRLLSVLEGESLVNDASALVLYRLATIALLTGVFSLEDATFEFAEVVFGGIVVGLGMGMFIQTVSRHFFDPIVGLIFSFTVPYITYIIADYFDVSGVLAVVVTGLFGSRMLFTHRSSIRRVIGIATWDIFIILLNCFVFILIGAQLGTITADMSNKQIFLYTVYGFLITVVLIIIRIAWVYTECSISYFRCGKKTQMFKEAAIIGWSGMRAIVSLTAALALPLTLSDGSELQGRDEVILITFMVIMFTLLIPGLTLPALIRWLKISYIPETTTATIIRKELGYLAESEIKRLHTSSQLNDEEFDFLRNYFNARQRIYETASLNPPPLLQSARLSVLHAQREKLLQMWKNKEIDDMHLRLLEREIDLEESHSVRAEIK